MLDHFPRGTSNRHLLLLSALAISATFSSISWRAIADDDKSRVTRIASRKTNAVHKPTSPFTRPTNVPWENVGHAEAYFESIPSELIKEPKLAQAFASLQSALLPNDKQESAESLVGQLQLWQAGLALTVREIPEEYRQDENRYSLQLGGSQFFLKFARQVDWSQIANRVNVGALVAPAEAAALRQMLTDKGVSDSLTLIPGDAQGRTANRTVQNLWSTVSGGVLTLVARIPQIDLDAEYLESKKSVPLQLLQRMQKDVEAVGIGFDFSDNPGTFAFRAAIAVQDGKAEKVLSIVRDLQSYLADASESTSDEGQPADRQLPIMASTWQAEIQQHAQLGTVVRIVGSIPVEGIVRL